MQQRPLIKFEVESMSLVSVGKATVTELTSECTEIMGPHYVPLEVTATLRAIAPDTQGVTT